MKKKLVSVILALVLVVSVVCTLVACNNGLDDTILKDAVGAAQKMTNEQLLEEAKKETGNFVAYGNTSRITTAMANFIASDYGKALGLTSDNAAAQKLNDTEIYTKLNSEMNNPQAATNASMVLIQDSATLMQYRASSNILTNYIPYGAENNVDSANLVPLAHQFINKLFMYNTSGETTAKFTNVWQLTESSYAGKIFFKSPKMEQVNMNFLIMLTSKDWSTKLESAYKSLYGKAATDIDAKGNNKNNTYVNYGYKWVAEFLNNVNMTITSDTTIASTLSKKDNAGNMGLFVLSKLRDKSVYGDNLQVSAWDKEGHNWVEIDPFAGFMYSIYAQLATYGPRPYTAMLFINYLMTEEGFTPWKSLGGYSANKEVPIYSGSLTTIKEVTIDSKTYVVYKDNNGKLMVQTGTDDKVKIYTYLDEAGTGLTELTIRSDSKITVKEEEKDLTATAVTVEVEGGVTDQPLSFWTSRLVIEDGTYINSAGKDVEDWILARAKENGTYREK